MRATRSGHASNEEPDDYFAILGEAHRDAVVGILVAEDRSFRLSRLAERVAAETRDVSPDDLTARDVERTKVELHHNHLPKLDDAGVVDYESEDGRVTPAAGIETAARLQRTVRAV